LAYAIFGSSRQLNVAPEASLSLITGQAISALLAENHIIAADPKDPGRYHREAVAITTIVGFQVGVFTLLLGLLRLGFVDVVLSRALLRGFVTAVVSTSSIIL
jgi:MFS superfamily sulfate permease-like transporter